MHFTDDELSRYSRQLLLRELGGPGQQALKRARMLIVGAGGLGSPASLYLAAAGVGHLMIVDPDVVQLSNLHRQIIYQSDDLGEKKALASRKRLTALNPNVAVDCLSMALDAGSSAELVRKADIVLDGTDNFETRLLVNAECVRQGKPLISGAIGRWTGQIGVFRGQPCYQCFLRDIPPETETCAAVGVVGALAGVIGSLMALEAIKIAARAGAVPYGKMLMFDGLWSRTSQLSVAAHAACPICSSVDGARNLSGKTGEHHERSLPGA